MPEFGPGAQAQYMSHSCTQRAAGGGRRAGGRPGCRTVAGGGLTGHEIEVLGALLQCPAVLARHGVRRVLEGATAEGCEDAESDQSTAQC